MAGNKGPSAKKPKRVTKKPDPQKALRPVVAEDPTPPIVPMGSPGGPGEAIGTATEGYVDPKVRTLREAISLARAFANLGESLLATATPENKNRVNFGSRLSGAVRRRSMDLTNALAVFRKP